MSTYVYDQSSTTGSPGTSAMGSGGQLMLGGIAGSAGQVQYNMLTTCGTNQRVIFAPFSRKVSPYDTFAYMLSGTSV